MVPMLVIFVAVILPQLYLHRHLETTLDVALTGLFGGLLVVYLMVFASFAGKLWRYKSSLKI